MHMYMYLHVRTAAEARTADMYSRSSSSSLHHSFLLVKAKTFFIHANLDRAEVLPPNWSKTRLKRLMPTRTLSTSPLISLHVVSGLVRMPIPACRGGARWLVPPACRFVARRGLVAPTCWPVKR